MGKYVMALDAGTTSNRAIVFDKRGQIISVAQKEFTQIFPQPGWVEHNANEIWSTMLGVAVEAVMKAGDDMMGTNPDLQCLFSDCNCARIRLWVPCADANGYESALLGGMDRMDGIRSEFESRVQNSLFKMAAPVFENILHKR